MVTAVETGNGITNGTNFVSPSTIPNEISETGSPATSIVGTLPYENGSNQLSIENIKYLILVVFGLMMIMWSSSNCKKKNSLTPHFNPLFAFYCCYRFIIEISLFILI